jgi:hypothetical protein
MLPLGERKRQLIYPHLGSLLRVASPIIANSGYNKVYLTMGSSRKVLLKGKAQYN